jgi:hypothetical protein
MVIHGNTSLRNPIIYCQGPPRVGDRELKVQEFVLDSPVIGLSGL